MHVNLISVTDPKAMLFFVMLQNIAIPETSSYFIIKDTQ